ncbi:MAG: glycoside hydrolase family 3 protein [Balneolaceae bacterium]
MKIKAILLFIILYSLSSCTSGQMSEFPPQEPSIDFKIGQMLKIGFRGLDISESSHIIRDLEEYHLGGVVLFDYDVPNREPVRNVESPAQVRKLVSDLKKHSFAPLLVTIDQEGGRVARLKTQYGFPASVSAQHLGESNMEDSTRFYTEITAQTLAGLGINTNLAPVADVNLNPENPIIGGIGRSFSGDPETVTKHASWFIESHHKHGVFTTLKHFPGHGSSEDDSHLGLVDVTELWSETELIPYRNLINDGFTDIIMTAHIFNENWDSEYPATLSGNVITGILREDLGFDGVVMSDDMQMDAIRAHYGLETAIEKAINAGVDILSFANNSVYDPDIVPKAHEIINKLLDEGRVSKERIDEAYQRIVVLKMKLN